MYLEFNSKQSSTRDLANEIPLTFKHLSSENESIAVYMQTSKFIPPAWPHDHVMSSNLVWISDEFNARLTFMRCISQLAPWMEKILDVLGDLSIVSFMLFPLAVSCGDRHCACSRDSGSNMHYLWFVAQTGAEWSYKTIFAAWIHYNQQYNILLLED